MTFLLRTSAYIQERSLVLVFEPRQAVPCHRVGSLGNAT